MSPHVHLVIGDVMSVNTSGSVNYQHSCIHFYQQILIKTVTEVQKDEGFLTINYLQIRSYE